MKNETIVAKNKTNKQPVVFKTDLSPSSINSGSTTTTTTAPGTNAWQFRVQEPATRFCDSNYERFFNLETSINSHPIKYLTEDNLAIYLNYLNVGYGGVKEPTARNLKLYQEFSKL